MVKKRDRKNKTAKGRTPKKPPQPLPEPVGWRGRVVGMVPPALLIGLQLGLFSVWQVYEGNQSEFDHGLLDMAPLFLLVAALLALVVVLLPLLLPKSSHLRVVALTTAAGGLLFVQSTFLVWDYGVFDGGAVQWGTHADKGWLELGLWITILGLAYFRPRLWVQQSRFVATLLIVIQFALLTAKIGRASCRERV